MRTTFLIDGFNLYHSVVDACYDLKGASTKWLDISSLCNSYLPIINKKARIEEIYYFSALAHHLTKRDPYKVKKHENFIECLKSTGIKDELGRFKPKRIKCNYCEKILIRHEEKETDVAISIKFFEIVMNKKCDVVVLMTGDTDISPAIKTIKRLFQNIKIWCAFPYKRKNNELAKLSDHSFLIKKERYLEHQFPNPFVLSSGKKIFKPTTW